MARRLLPVTTAAAACLCALPSHGVEPTPLSPEQLAVSSVRVAAVQMSGTWMWQGNDDAPQDTVDDVIAHIEAAAEKQVDLIAFPELLLGKFRVPNRSTQRIGEAAARHRIHVVVGCFEVLDAVGHYANCSLLFDRAGAIAGRYYKTHPATDWPPGQDDPEWLMTPGNEFPVFDLDFGRIGIVTCYDGYFPETFRILALKGAEIIVWMNARPGSVETHITRTTMQQNYVHMVCTNKAGGGGTMVASWPDTIEAITEQTGDAFLSADLDLANLRAARRRAREFFQRRPEIYGEILGAHPVWRLYGADRVDTDIRLRPVRVENPVQAETGMAEGTQLSRLAIEVTVPWLDGWLQLRLPEVLQSNLGTHFIDHYTANALQMGPLDRWPEWRLEERTGEWWYDLTTQEGLRLRASARPHRDELLLELTVHNGTGQDLAWVTTNPCFMFDGAPCVHHRWDLGTISAVIDGEWQPLSTTTPTPEHMGRQPWIIMRTKEWPDAWTGPADSSTWWLLDQFADANLMGIRTKDGKHLVAYAWDTPAQVLMSNGGYPCLHTGPGPILALADGASATRRGKIYLVENKPQALLERFRRDKRTWANWPVRPPEP